MSSHAENDICANPSNHKHIDYRSTVGSLLPKTFLEFGPNEDQFKATNKGLILLKSYSILSLIVDIIDTLVSLWPIRVAVQHLSYAVNQLLDSVSNLFTGQTNFVKIKINKAWFKTIANDSKREISSGRNFLGRGPIDRSYIG